MLLASLGLLIRLLLTQPCVTLASRDSHGFLAHHHRPTIGRGAPSVEGELDGLCNTSGRGKPGKPGKPLSSFGPTLGSLTGAKGPAFFSFQGPESSPRRPTRRPPPASAAPLTRTALHRNVR